MQTLDFVPEVRNKNGQLRPPSEFKTLAFQTKEESQAVYCLLNSTLFRWFMDVVSDGSHLNKREIDNFPLVPVKSGLEAGQFSDLAKRLTRQLKSTSETRVMRYKHDTLTVQCIIPKTAKFIIDEIDTALARFYGFTEEELDFIINYDIKYRMGKDDGDDE